MSLDLFWWGGRGPPKPLGSHFGVMGAGGIRMPRSLFGVMGGMLGCLGSFLGAPTHLGLLGRGLGLPPPYSRRGAPGVLVPLPGAP